MKNMAIFRSDAFTEGTVHAFRVDALQERQRRQGQEVSTEQKLKFMRLMRAQWAKDSRPQAVQMATAILADIERLDKFTRRRA